MCKPESQPFEFPFFYVDNPPFSVPDRSELWAGQCTACLGVHLLRQASFPCCSNPECRDGGEVQVVTPEFQAVLISTYFLGGHWAVIQLLNDLK